MNRRIVLVDCLRGFAIAGIIIFHFLEHLNFYVFPECTPFEQGLWDTVAFLCGSKMYAIFALMFGVSCFIQHDNQRQRGYDFRPRFAWRMLLLFCWALLDLTFFNGDVLCIYAVLGLLLIPMVNASNKVLIAIIVVLLLQPIELYYAIAGTINPELQPLDLGVGAHWAAVYQPIEHGGILDVARANLAHGLQINFGWALEHGRFTPTLLLFVIGMLLGRKRLFYNEGDNLKAWVKVCIASLVAFAVFQPLVMFVPEHIDGVAAKRSINTMLTAWRNLSMMAFYISALTLLFYRTKASSAIGHLRHYGKMSLTLYLLQSIVGGFIFYNWGLAGYKWSSHGYSFLLSIAFLLALYFFCRTWNATHRRGPLEQLWHRATWLK